MDDQREPWLVWAYDNAAASSSKEKTELDPAKDLGELGHGARTPLEIFFHPHNQRPPEALPSSHTAGHDEQG